MRELDDIDLLVICAEAVTEPQGLALMAWTCKCCRIGAGLTGELARILQHPSFDWYARRHASFLMRLVEQGGNWYEELR